MTKSRPTFALSPEVEENAAEGGKTSLISRPTLVSPHPRNIRKYACNWPQLTLAARNRDDDREDEDEDEDDGTSNSRSTVFTLITSCFLPFFLRLQT